ncbi:MAG: Pls/PosA family non-ribosomal peptide synthetase [Acidimicrobiales bacterium]
MTGLAGDLDGQLESLATDSPTIAAAETVARVVPPMPPMPTAKADPGDAEPFPPPAGAPAPTAFVPPADAPTPTAAPPATQVPEPATPQRPPGASENWAPPPMPPGATPPSAKTVAPATTPTTDAGVRSEDIEQILAEELLDLVPVDEVLPDGDFFDDLGADSMVMARFCARARKRSELPAISMKDVYENPTVSRLAAAVGGAPALPVVPIAERASNTTDVVAPARTATHLLCGTLQFLFLLGYGLIGSLIAVRGFLWLLAATDVVGLYLRSTALLSGAFVFFSIVPILAKWLLIGRWKTRHIRLWSLGYFRFWVVKSLIRSSPLALINGSSKTSSASPIFTLYLRALGAKVGRNVTFLSNNVPVCTDLLTIGDNTVVRKDSFINCYRARSGVIEPGPVSLGKHVFVGEATVLDIHTAIEDGAELGHASSLQYGQVIPADQHYQGAPAEPVEVDFRTSDVVGGTGRRRAVYGAFQLLNPLLLTGPIALTIAILLIAEIPQLMAIVDPANSGLTGAALVWNAVAVSTALLVGSIILGLLIVGTVPRYLNRFLEPDKTYPIFGIHYFIHRLIAGMTNVEFFTILFGDSSFIVHYLRWIGYDLGRVEQTGSNFGAIVKHESPFLTSVGTGTVVADGLSVVNADFSSTSFRLAPVSVGSNNFLGNNIVYSSNGKTGDDCLLGTKVAVPVTGSRREGVGLLGSPSFEIPRSVDRDRALEIAYNEELLRPLLLTSKNRHNVVTMGLYLLTRLVLSVGLLLLAMAIFSEFRTRGPWVVAVAAVVTPVLVIGYWTLVHKTLARLQALEPDGCSIYHRNFWRHERFWKVPAFRYIQAYNGTPFKPVIWRLLGVDIGKKVFDDGAFIIEKAFASIGDNCILNAGSIIQCHSQEDGGFKSDRTSLGSGCTLGVGAFVHYGVTMGDDATLSTDSFLMKGQEIPPQTVWTGNPAQEVPK